MASMSLLRVLCLRHEQAESEEVVMWLLGRQERAVYGEMLLELLGKRDEEAQVGAGCFLIVAAWVRRLEAFQTCSSSKSSTLRKSPASHPRASGSPGCLCQRRPTHLRVAVPPVPPVHPLLLRDWRIRTLAARSLRLRKMC